MIDRGKEFSISYPLISSLLSFRKAEQIRMKEWAPCCYIEVKVSVIPRQNLLYFRVDGSPTTRTQPRQDFSCACVILFISALTVLWPRASGLWNVEMACVKSKREGRENVWEQKHMLLLGSKWTQGKRHSWGAKPLQKVYRIKLAQRRIKKRIAISENLKSRFLLEPAITTTTVKYAFKWKFCLRS